jgi:hypothetical protein
MLFVLEDEFHCETQGNFPTFEAAVAEAKRHATLPWDQAPNIAPCTSWKTCGRRYVVIEYDDSVTPWTHIGSKFVLELSAKGVVWGEGFSETS